MIADTRDIAVGARIVLQRKVSLILTLRPTRRGIYQKPVWIFIRSMIVMVGCLIFP